MTRAAVIGAGFAGLTAALRLAQAGHEVTVFEAEDRPGGLASSFRWRDTLLDRHFHFVCAGDRAYLDLLDELGMSGSLHWTRTRTGHFRDGVRHDFDSPLSLLGFRVLPLGDRIRFGASVLRARSEPSRDLDGISARDWVIAEQGERVYDIIWRPLLEMKFGRRAGDVSAEWLRQRVRRLAGSRTGPLLTERLGFVSGGAGAVALRLVAAVVGLGGELRYGEPVEEIVTGDSRVSGVRTAAGSYAADIVVSTVATPLFLGLVPGLPEPLAGLLRSVEYLGVETWVVLASAPLTRDFWLNVDDGRVPFPGVVSYSMLDPEVAPGAYLHYVPVYLPHGDPRWDVPESVARGRLLAGLDAIAPGFSSRVLDVFRFRDPWAQPVFDVGFGERLSRALSPETPVHGLYRTDMSQTYPHDRSLVNAAAKGGEAGLAAAAHASPAPYTGREIEGGSTS